MIQKDRQSHQVVAQSSCHARLCWHVAGGSAYFYGGRSEAGEGDVLLYYNGTAGAGIPSRAYNGTAGAGIPSRAYNGSACIGHRT